MEMKLTLTLATLLLATSASAFVAPDPTPDPTPDPEPEASAPDAPEGHEGGSTACEHYPSGECPGAWVNPPEITDQKYRGNGKGGKLSVLKERDGGFYKVGDEG